MSKYYKFYNPNPLGKEVGDCIIRSLCAVTGQDWFSLYDQLSQLGRTLCTPFNCIDLNVLYEQHFGFIKGHLKRQKGVKACTVAKFCKDHPKGTYIVRLAHHVMAVKDGQYHDIYACWDKSTVYTYYTKED